MFKKIKIFLIVFVAGLFISTSLWSLRYYIDRKNIRYQNIIFNAPNFDDAVSNYIKLDRENIKSNGMISPGDLVIYYINYKNNGEMPVEDFSILVHFSDNCNLVEENLKDYSYRYDKEERKIIFNMGRLDVLDGGTIKLILKTIFPLDNGTEINSPEVLFRYFKKNETIEKEGYFEEKILPTRDLRITSSPSLNEAYIKLLNREDVADENNVCEVTIGDKLVYEVFIVNSGNMNARDINVTIDGVDYLDVVEEGNSNFDLEDGKIFWDIPLLEVGRSVFYKFETVVNKDVENGSKIMPSLSITCGGNEVNKFSEEVIARLLPSFEGSNIKLTDQNGGDTYSGEIVSVNVKIVNTGDIKANNIKVKIIPSNLFNLYEGSLSWEIESLDVNETVNFNSLLKVVDGVSKDSYASCKLEIASDELDPQIVFNSSLLISGSRPFTRNYIPIIALHGIEPNPQGRYEISTGTFEYLLNLLKSHGYQTITFMDLLNYLDYGKALPEKPVIITSDDGYQSIYTYAFPILKKYGYKMTVFLITSYIGDSESTRRLNEFDEIGGEFNIPSRPMLIWPEIAQMARYGCEFLSHTWSHGIISNMPLDSALKELVQSKSDIETHIGKPVLFVAWPHGASSSQVISLLPQAGYRGAVGYGGGVEDVRTLNIYNIKRVKIVSEISPLAYAELLKLK